MSGNGYLVPSAQRSEKMRLTPISLLRHSSQVGTTVDKKPEAEPIVGYNMGDFNLEV